MKIEHIGIAVKDIAASNEIFSALLGVKPYKEERVESENVITSFFQVGDSKIELLQATSPDSAIAKFLEKNKEGMHHIAFEVHDIYAEITDSKSPTDRKMTKLALLIYLNGDEKEAKLAITGEFNALTQEEKKEYTLGKPSLLWHLINDYFLSEGMPIKEDYQGDNNIGLKLQNQDSELAAIVIERLRMVGVPVLVVHDSFIVQERYQHITEQVMSQCFKIMFDDGGLYAKVPLTIEEKRNGIVTKQRKSV